MEEGSLDTFFLSSTPSRASSPCLSATRPRSSSFDPSRRANGGLRRRAERGSGGVPLLRDVEVGGRELVSSAEAYPLVYPLLCLNRVIGLYIAPIHRRPEGHAEEAFRYSRVGLSVCLLLLAIHLVMGVDDMIVLLSRLQVDGLFHLETLIAALVSTFQWHAILIICNHLATAGFLHRLVGQIPGQRAAKSMEEAALDAAFERSFRLIVGSLAGFSLLFTLSIVPLSGMLFVHLSLAEESFHPAKDSLILVGPALMTSELLVSVLLFVALCEIVGHCWDRFRLHVEGLGHLRHFRSLRELKAEFFQLVEVSQTLDSVFTWSNFLSICFASMNVSLSVFTYIHLNETEARRYREFGLTPIWVLAVLNALQMYLIMAILLTGTRFNGRSRSAKDALLRKDFDPAPRDKHALDTVLRKVHERDWGLTAGRFFLIDQSSMLTIIGMILTYVTVLVQIGWNAPSSPHNTRLVPTAASANRSH